ncbi:MAG: acyl-CoA reductase, partial [Bacteroidota bacterium]
PMPSNPSAASLVHLLHCWGQWMGSTSNRDDWSEWSSSVAVQNPWFEPEMLRQALKAWSMALDPRSLERWLAHDKDALSLQTPPRNVGLILPGNIPLAGLHDVLCTLIAGHTALVKPSSDDAGLVSWAVQGLLALQPEWSNRFALVDKLNRVDALIATGSTSSLPYFEQYFGQIPHLFRSHRNSIAILDGKEKTEDWIGLSQDIFLYYGKGCRNVSKLLVPEGMSPQHILDGLQHYPWEGQNHRYRNNLDYQLALYMLNRKPFTHNSSVILVESPTISSPLAVLHFEYYQSEQDLARQVLEAIPVTQCWSGNQLVARWGQRPYFKYQFNEEQWNTWCTQSVEFGQCQFPEIDRYADAVDTLSFLRGVQ